jgi:hypothetical protein
MSEPKGLTDEQVKALAEVQAAIEVLNECATVARDAGLRLVLFVDGDDEQGQVHAHLDI